MRSIFITPYDNDTGVSLDAILAFHEAMRNTKVFKISQDDDYEYANIVCKNEHCNWLEGWPRSENGYRAAIRYIEQGCCHACKYTGTAQ